MVDSMARERLTEGEVWQWVQALNGLRLVIGTRLDVQVDDEGERFTEGPEARLWATYEVVTVLQGELVAALGR